MRYCCIRFGTLSELTQFLNEKNDYIKEIIYIGIERGDFCLIYLRRELSYIKLETGHWIYMGDRCIRCSECGHITKTESPDCYNYCMVCGVKMVDPPERSED